jgi:hypothetical protein
MQCMTDPNRHVTYKHLCLENLIQHCKKELMTNARKYFSVFAKYQYRPGTGYIY